MTNKRKKVDKQNYPKKQTKPKKALSGSKVTTNKNEYANSIEKIGNYVSDEMQKYNEDILRSNDILFIYFFSFISQLKSPEKKFEIICLKMFVKFNNNKNYFVFGGIMLSFIKFSSPVVANKANFA